MINNIRANFQADSFHLISFSSLPIFTVGILLSFTTTGVLSMHAFEYASSIFFLSLFCLVYSVSLLSNDIIALFYNRYSNIIRVTISSIILTSLWFKYPILLIFSIAFPFILHKVMKLSHSLHDLSCILFYIVILGIFWAFFHSAFSIDCLCIFEVDTSCFFNGFVESSSPVDATGNSGSSSGGEPSGGSPGGEPGAPQDPIVAHTTGDSSSSEGESDSSSSHSSGNSSTSESPPHDCPELVPIPMEFIDDNEEPCSSCGDPDPEFFCEVCGSLYHAECAAPGTTFFD